MLFAPVKSIRPNPDKPKPTLTAKTKKETKEVIAKVFNTGIASSRQYGTRKDTLHFCGHCEECSDEAISINVTFATGSKKIEFGTRFD
jgi:hypothetical protein